MMTMFSWDDDRDGWGDQLLCLVDSGPMHEPECRPIWIGARQAAKFLGLTKSQLEGEIRNGTGPPFDRFEGRLYFDKHALERFIRARDKRAVVRTTSAEVATAVMRSAFAGAARSNKTVAEVMRVALAVATRERER